MSPPTGIRRLCRQLSTVPGVDSRQRRRRIQIGQNGRLVPPSSYEHTFRMYKTREIKLGVCAYFV